MNALIIEGFNENHLKDVAALEKECFSTPWSEAGLKAELTNPFARFFVARVNGSVAGYIGAHNVFGEVYITNIAVSEGFRKKGIGSALIKSLVSCAEREAAVFVTLEVRKSNLPAIALYEKSGFEKVGERVGFYENPKEDALLMTYYFKKQEDNL